MHRYAIYVSVGDDVKVRSMTVVEHIEQTLRWILLDVSKVVGRQKEREKQHIDRYRTAPLGEAQSLLASACLPLHPRFLLGGFHERLFQLPEVGVDHRQSVFDLVIDALYRASVPSMKQGRICLYTSSILFAASARLIAPWHRNKASCKLVTFPTLQNASPDAVH